MPFSKLALVCHDLMFPTDLLCNARKSSSSIEVMFPCLVLYSFLYIFLFFMALSALVALKICWKDKNSIRDLCEEKGRFCKVFAFAYKKPINLAPAF